jgi:DNA-binding NarL/FixJ family response regulator
MKPIRVLLADDHPVLRTAVRALLETEPDMVVAGEAASGEEAVALALALSPDVVVMDVTMHGCGGLEATRVIAASTCSRILVLTMHAEDDGLLAALHAGASGYLTKTAAPEELVRAVRLLARGEVALSPASVRALVRAVARGTRRDERPQPAFDGVTSWARHRRPGRPRAGA